MVDLVRLKQAFGKGWVDSISKAYFDYVQKLINEGVKFNTEYFPNPGDYSNRHNYCSAEACSYFNNILHPTNICILDYILKHYDEFKGFKCLDNGSGLGVLSIFLNKLGIECFNYDDFSQIGHVNFDDFLFERNKIKINEASNSLPTEADVL